MRLALDALTEIIGVSADPPDRNLAWTGRLNTWNLAKRVTFVIDRAGRIRHVEPGRLAVDTSRTLDAVQKLARAK